MGTARHQAPRDTTLGPPCRQITLPRRLSGMHACRDEVAQRRLALYLEAKPASRLSVPRSAV